jgi:hypothetical protein
MTVRQVARNEIQFDPMSYADSGGRLFRWDGGLYRMVSPERVELYQSLLDTGLAARLSDKGLVVETSPAPFLVDASPVLQHREVRFISYPYEWPSCMLRDAALTTLDLAIELAQHGLALQDAHPWNVLFDGPRATYVDFGSIYSCGSAPNFAYAEFLAFFLYPLHLMARGHGRLARLLLHDHERGVLKSEFEALVPRRGMDVRKVAKRAHTYARAHLPSGVRSQLGRLRRRVHTTKKHPTDVVQTLSTLRAEVAAIPLGIPDTVWSGYYVDEFPPFNDSSAWNEKHAAIARILDTLNPSSIADIGSNEGWYSQLAAQHGCEVVSFDTDESTITRLYRTAKSEKLQILPLVMSVTNPSPPAGPINEWPSAIRRLQCDAVFALALVHHLVFFQALDFSKIVPMLSAYAKKALIVEFIPANDQYVREWMTPAFGWYSLENFVAAVSEHWGSIDIVPSTGVRRLLVCQDPLADLSGAEH